MPPTASGRVEGAAFGAYVRKRRRSLKTSQAELGEACGLSVSRVQAIELGAIAFVPQPKQLAGLAATLRVSVNMLLELAGYRESGVTSADSQDS